jgi:hypothetical protein
VSKRTDRTVNRYLHRSGKVKDLVEARTITMTTQSREMTRRRIMKRIKTTITMVMKAAASGAGISHKHS